MVANKTDLCSRIPTVVPSIEYGEAVHTSPAPDDSGLKPRAISPQEGAMFAKQHGLLYVETSAKEGWGVEDAFEKSAREVLERIQKGAFEAKKVGA